MQKERHSYETQKMKIVFTLLVGLISLPIFAQQSYQTVRGTITEQGTGNAIMHA